MKKILRRTKREISAGLTLVQKAQGLTIVDIIEPRKEQTPEEKYFNGDIIRRTKEEIGGGLTLEEKRQGKTLEQKKEGIVSSKRASVAHSPTKEDLDRMKDKLIPVEVKEIIYKDAEELDADQYDWKGDSKVVINNEIKYIKEIVFVEKGKNKNLVQDIIKNELYKCQREWLEVVMDEKFRFSDVEKLGKQGWNFAYTHCPSVFKEGDTKKYPDIMLFSRVKTK